MELYPLKFEPILREKIWGGDRLSKVLNKSTNGLQKVGESWELSSIAGDVSVVADGDLKGQNIIDLIKAYKADLVGKHVYEKFGNQFPLLLKFIDANEYLSVQVHPDDELAIIRHNSFGKNEMWYVIEAEKDAELIVGFNQELNRSEYLNHVNDGTLKSALNFEKVQAGDVFHLPAGRIHATGPGILFAEIQQTSDITYRIYDWDRVDTNGIARELHTELAADAIDFTLHEKYKTPYNSQENTRTSIEKCTYYTINVIEFDKAFNLDYSALDSFVALMVVEGEFTISYANNSATQLVRKGETVLIPNAIKNLVLSPKQNTCKVLEVYIDN